MDLNQRVLDWLLEEKDPSVRYRTLTEVLGRPADDPEVIAARAKIPASKEVTQIMSKLGEDGLWPHKAAFYGTFTTIDFLWGLAELGMHRDLDPRIDRIVEWHFSTDYGKVDYSLDSGCRQLPVIATLVKLGYLQDERVQEAIAQLRRGVRFDGGYLCRQFKVNPKFKGREPKSCIRACEQALWAYAALPADMRTTPESQQLADYFLRRRVIFSTINPAKKIGFDRTSYPIYGLNFYLYGLALLGAAGHPALAEVWALMEKKRDADGRYLMERTGSKNQFNAGKPGQPNKWITLQMMAAKQQLPS